MPVRVDVNIFKPQNPEGGELAEQLIRFSDVIVFVDKNSAGLQGAREALSVAGANPADIGHHDQIPGRRSELEIFLPRNKGVQTNISFSGFGLCLADAGKRNVRLNAV